MILNILNSSHFAVIGLFILVLYIFILVLLTIAFTTLLERKILSSMQLRRGPNRVGFLGLLQPIADGLKLFTKETIFPQRANIFVFFVSPMTVFGIGLFG
jgi:NADH:ubiquinone oxidoreductase subunit H